MKQLTVLHLTRRRTVLYINNFTAKQIFILMSSAAVVKLKQIWRRADTYQRWGQTMCSGWDRVCVPTSSLTECDEARSSNDSTSSRLQHTRRDTDESVIQITNQSSTLLDHSLLLKKLTQLTERKWDGKRGHKIMLNEYYLIIYLLTYLLTANISKVNKG